ncbi:A disintegrin and metalloproteinase with thrombospondin motifs 7 [Apis mellifera]|uniref:A disintegrin and metalloproteinase with thrombospondin motifs 7 n=1 Tax=Apis mellifera TaxID=7460 RepID=A0A7M7MKK9_APIME|nr:A disintegrin and metalloproteinase with thrombospondin motifs 7 [Apis mellifera]|eukprot:XP_026296950.1 A disintegrin and metalloproteinase with thrombospondin motifs 7 [Apis mellifera]
MAKTIAKRAFSSQKRHPPKNQANSYTMELLLVLDKTVLDYHKDFDVENYALTLLNMAAALLHDVSLGINMELTIVRIIRMLVQENEMSLTITKDTNATLKYFQKWQRMINPGDDTHPNHHDCAILITKSNICDSPSVCGFTGTSTIAGTCDPLKGAAIINDVGLHTGYHIAHHLGHTLGMSHDVKEENGCPGIIHHENYIETTVMHPGNLYITRKWSVCSKESLRLYIETDLGFCLVDKQQNYEFPSTELLPGVMYNADDQCRIEYGLEARHCDLEVKCESLRCAIPGKGCVSTMEPVADGTRCGENRWCYGMKCLLVGERPGVVDGGWSNWSPWSRCSRTCGSGVTLSVRRCVNPVPSNGGAFCRGDRKRHKICTTEPCDVGAPSFRDVQCSGYNNWIFPEDGKLHQWSEYKLPEDLRISENPCTLYCVNEKNVVASLNPRVVDGTTCYRGIRNICIGGICREIPCDLNMESNAIEDACGVCKGNGTSCSLKSYTTTIVQASRPTKLVEIPLDATNVRVEEMEPSKSRIMVWSKDEKPLIRGDRLGLYEIAGMKAWLGAIRLNQETLVIPGPIFEELIILILPKENVTVRYSFGVREKSPRKPEFSWNFLDWEECNANCGPGEQISKPRCLEKHAGLVDDTFCKSMARPQEKVRPCYRAPCVPRWVLGDWQGCTSCTFRCENTRSVKCVRPVGHSEQDVDIIADSYCEGPKPKEREPCAGREKRSNDNIPTTRSKRWQKDSDEKKLRIKRKHEEEEDDDDDDDDDEEEEERHEEEEEEREEEEEEREEEEEEREEEEEEEEEKEEKKEEEDRLRIQQIKKGEEVIDSKDVHNLTLNIILEHDATGALIFPKDFVPQPPSNSTVFTLVGMDAVKYIQKIQEDAVTPSKRHS